MDFKELGLSEPVMESLHRLGFTIPTPIQTQAIPPLLQGRDLMGRAETGSGKTLAFGLPLVERVEAGRVSIQALVVCPTRELAQQVAEDIENVGREKGVKVALVVGGVHVRTQRMQIPGKQVVVGTPGRIIDLLTDRFLPIEWVEYFVLDEFDRLLDMGFLDDIRRIVKRLPDEHQTALFSATVPKLIVTEANKLLKNPVQVQIGSARRAVDTIKQRAIRTSSAKKLAIVEHILKQELENEGSVVIFCNTKKAVRLVDRELWAKNLSVAALSGDHEQSVRFKVMERFRNREIRVLVATDVAARGLDIDHIGHVVNFDVPFESEDYMHRIGRTGRAGRDGVVTTLIGNDDYQKFERIRHHIEQDIEMLSERCEPLTEKKNDRSSSKPAARGRGKDNADGEKPRRAPKKDEPKDREEPKDNAASSTPTDDSERPRRARRRSRRPDRDGERQEERAGSSTEDRSDPAPRNAPAADPQAETESNEEAPAKPRRRSRGATRGRGRKVVQDNEAAPAERADEANERSQPDSNEEDKPRRSRRRRRNSERNPAPAAENDREEKPSNNTDDSSRPEREGGRQRRRRGPNDRKPAADQNKEGSPRQRNDPAPKTEKVGEKTEESKDSKRPQRGVRGTRGRGRKTTERKGRRSQSDHERWEREQLDRPVDLIEDNWQSVDGSGKSAPSNNKGSAESSRGRGNDNDNAPAPFEASEAERAALAGSGARKKSSRRRSRPQDENRAPRNENSEPTPRKKQSDTPPPAKSKPVKKDQDNDIVW